MPIVVAHRLASPIESVIFVAMDWAMPTVRALVVTAPAAIFPVVMAFAATLSAVTARASSFAVVTDPAAIFDALTASVSICAA